jgi:hypothetical protein
MKKDKNKQNKTNGNKGNEMKDQRVTEKERDRENLKEN